MYIKIKHKVKWVVKFAYTHSFLSTTKHLRKIRRLGYKQFLYFLLYVNSLKKLFVSKTKFNCFLKMSIFSYSLLPKIFKFRRSSLRLAFLIKIVHDIVRTPPPASSLFKAGGSEFWLPPPEWGIWKIRKTGQVQGQVCVC